MNNVLSGLHALVTGGGSGIGAATAAALKDQGATVTIIGRDARRLQRKAAELAVHPQVTDVTDASSVEHGFNEASAANGPIDILVNNAGAAEATPFLKTDAEIWQRMLAVNLTGVYHCTQAVIPGMLAAGKGRIINIASTAALKGYAYVSAYCAAKHGVLGLTRALAREYASKGITVNAVCPGYTDTDIVDDSIQNIVRATGRSAEQALADLLRDNPQGRLIKPREVAEAVVWLCQENSSSVNGQAITVDGGEVM